MKRIALWGTVLIFAAACGAKQTKKPDIDDDLMKEEGSADMDAEPTEIAPAEGGETVDRRTECCQACVDAVGKDESGDPPGALSCKSFEGMSPACIVFFNETPMNGKEAQACVAEGGTSDGGAADGEAADGDAEGG